MIDRPKSQNVSTSMRWKPVKKRDKNSVVRYVGVYYDGAQDNKHVVLQYREVDISSGRQRAVTDWQDVEIKDD